MDLDAGAKVIAHFVVTGPPRTKKNSARIFKRADGSPFIMPSKQAKSWQKDAAAQIARQNVNRLHLQRPVNVVALVYRERAVGDLVNYLQAIADALEQAGVVRNDKWIVTWDGSRLKKDKARPRVEITITETETP